MDTERLAAHKSEFRSMKSEPISEEPKKKFSKRAGTRASVLKLSLWILKHCFGLRISEFEF
jgi:hypothetical protein